MPLYFSPAALAFFDSQIHDVLPVDARAVTVETHAQLMEMQGEGHRIVANDNGDPVAAPPLPLTTQAQLAALRQRRDRMLSACDHTQIPDVPMTDVLRAQWAAYRQALRDLPELTADLGAIAWPSPPTV